MKADLDVMKRTPVGGLGAMVQLVQGPAFRAQLAKLGGKAWDAERAIALMRAMGPNIHNLYRCSQWSIMNFMLECARRGMLPDARRGLCPIVFGDKTGAFNLVAHATYQGLVDALITRGVCTKVKAQVVYERDHFEIHAGDDDKIIHRPYIGSDEPGGKVGAYACFWLPGGGVHHEWMPARAVIAIRDAALRRSRGSGSWANPEWEPWMWRKTVIIQGSKLLPMPIEAARLLEDADVDASPQDLVASMFEIDETAGPVQVGEGEGGETGRRAAGAGVRQALSKASQAAPPSPPAPAPPQAPRQQAPDAPMPPRDIRDGVPFAPDRPQQPPPGPVSDYRYPVSDDQLSPPDPQPKRRPGRPRKVQPPATPEAIDDEQVEPGANDDAGWANWGTPAGDVDASDLFGLGAATEPGQAQK